ncbi:MULTISPECIES: hypothetical protein [Corynebacterium]|jgi:hypothetical protein|uniref:hypothetical protein n=1 Tax=Corynebacterium TaxID=1716 RepID=UPI002542AAFB|nr:MULTISPECIES: hypothetical protein [Corynebacterium]MDK4328426.1 hypothetical protein [Corynebacterium pseudodiphtheriticum]WKS45826.1 hypothetical protein NLL36_04760 [Corynebacterium propinquum]
MEFTITTKVEDLIYHGYNAQDLADLECNITLYTDHGRFYKAVTDDWENEEKFDEAYETIVLQKLAEKYAGEEGAEPASDKQISFITSLYNQCKAPKGASRINLNYGAAKKAFSDITANLSKQTASQLIDDMQATQPVHSAIAKVKLEGSNVVAE